MVLITQLLCALSLRFYRLYDAMHNLSMAEDSVWPEKYEVGDTMPSISAFPPEHPNKINFNVKEEL